MTVANGNQNLTLLARIEQLAHERERYYNEARRLRASVEKKDLRLDAMRRDQRVLTRRLYLYEKDVARLEHLLATANRAKP